MATVVQTAENLNRSAVAATFPAPVTAGNVMLCAMVGQGVSPAMDPNPQAGGYVGTGWTWLGPLQGDAASEVTTLQARIYAKVAIGGETQVHRLHDSSAQTMTILEVSGISLSAIADSLQLDNDNQGSPATFDLGTLTGDGWAIQLTTYGRDHGATTIFATTPGTGWTEITDRGEPIIVTAGQMHVQVRDVTGSADAEITATESGGAGIGTGGGVAFLFDGTVLVADFAGTPLSGLAPLEVTFTDLRVVSQTITLTISKTADAPERIVEVDGRLAADPRLLDATQRLTAAVLPELDLGADPLIRWFRTLAPGEQPEPGQRRSVIPRSVGGPLHGGVPSYVGWNAETGWQPDGRPELWLHISRTSPNDVLHELRHLWQRKHAPHLLVDHYEGPHTPNEIDATDWARAVAARIGASTDPTVPRLLRPSQLGAGPADRRLLANRRQRRAAPKRRGK